MFASCTVVHFMFIVLKWQLVCKFGIVERIFLLITCLNSCLVHYPKSCLFSSRSFTLNYFFHTKFVVMSYSIVVVFTPSYFMSRPCNEVSPMSCASSITQAIHNVPLKYLVCVSCFYHMMHKSHELHIACSIHDFTIEQEAFHESLFVRLSIILLADRHTPPHPHHHPSPTPPPKEPCIQWVKCNVSKIVHIVPSANSNPS